MKNIKLVSFVIVLVLVSISCSLFAPTSSKNSDINQIFDEVPAYDPEAPLPSSGAAALRLLAELDPSVGVLETDVEESEREALNALLADLQVQLDEGNGKQVPFMPSQSGRMKVAIPVARAFYPAGNKLAGDSGNFSFEAMFIAILTSQVSDSLAVTPGAGENKSATGAEGGAVTNNGVKFTKNPDGSTSLELVNKTDASKDGVTATTDSKVSIDGWRCPNDAGQVSFTIKERFNGESGGASYTVDLSADVRAEVNDDAEMVNMTIDTTQGTRRVKDGKNVYVESGVTNKNGSTSNQRVIRSSQDATSDDVANLSAAGEAAAYNMALGSLLFAQSNWEKGGCTEIKASLPESVQTGSTTSIPVTVSHKFDGSEVPSKLKAVLSGEKSVNPTTLPMTPGTLTYTAPDENGKTATITLTSTSKRGKATLELTTSTGGAAYQIVGGLDEFQTNSAVCDIMGPFTLTGGGFALKFSGGLSGTYTYSGGPFGASGSGSYTISLPDGLGKPGSMTGSGSGCVETELGTFCNSGAEKYTLSPLPEGSCP
jgi:hypothetical protein